ncbi:hypothetical protein N7462_005765 [Penicillium macrosclerotiorum]|uniref:uncharacterized protein n=1 Tax=Penicillium macrosclerotiorum TaxID=303699 RepID=UPI00254747B4|nr:uncharacterized protein N7462_005765 [Penicillium macrosclerotiorum]KAJ5682600.1 hypothetical protein N7462_005765 [Penicillium macrosclerotiorum]
MNHAVCDPCYTCRNRRIQCDQSGVPCSKCQKAGLECLDKRPIRWVKGVAIRGKMQGRSFGNANTSFPQLKNQLTCAVKSKQSLMNSSFTCGRSFNSSDNERICKLFIVYDTKMNPFRNLIPLGLKDPTLMKALLALAARHHANTGQSFSNIETPTSPQLLGANRAALSFKHQAMEALTHSLRDSNLSKQDTTVASIFLLIFLDLLESGSDGWNFHLEGAKNLIASTYPLPGAQASINNVPGQTVQEIRAFITKQIKLIETLGATFLRPKLLSQFATFDQQELQLQETIEASFLGCPDYILTAIQCLSMQRDSISGSVPLDDDATTSHLQETSSLLELIQNFDCFAWASNLEQSRNPSPQEVLNLCTLSRSYKLGALVYGKRIHDSLTGGVTVLDDVISELLGLIDSLKNDHVLFKCVLWPIFVAGLECHWQVQRDFLVGCMEQFWDITSCLNAVNAARILQDYWKQSDASGQAPSQWIFDIGRLGRDWLWI